MIVRILVGLAGTALGVAMLIKTEWFLRMLGKNDWAERVLGVEGGTRLFYKLIGFGILILAWFYAFGWWNALLDATIGGLFRGRGITE